MESTERRSPVDFSNTEVAFSNKTNKELKKMYWLFKLMNKPTLVKVGAALGNFAVKYRLPFAKSIVRNTIFKQFCGGETLLESQQAIDKLYRSNILTILDYGAEGKSGEVELGKVGEQFVRGVEFAASNECVPVVSVKLTAIGENKVLEKKHAGTKLSTEEEKSWQQLHDRLEKICKTAHDLGVGVFIDAEESWMQQPMDDLADEMMAKYNQERVVVYNTFQLYRHDRLEFLKASHRKALESGYMLGAKMVRGAYMEKERARAEEMGYPSPIHKSKEDTDKDYNLALKYCLDHYDTIASCAATHNEQSCFYQAQLIEERNMPNDHPHLNFCQLMGMSDNITFNLADAGYNVAKYVVYGKIEEVLPYLTRRAEENTSVTGDMSRELTLIEREVKRRAQ